MREPAGPRYDTTDTPTPAASSAAARSLAVLRVVAGEGKALSLADIAVRIGLPKASAHRICEQLVEQGYLLRDIAERSFAVGPRLRRLAFDTLNHGSFKSLRHEVLATLVREVGETCNFTTLDGTSVLYLDRVEAQWPLRLTLDVGAHVPLHCTASGKLMLSVMPRAERDAVIGRLTLERMTPATITSVAALKAECERIAVDGHSCDREEFMSGLVAVAVPVRDAGNSVRAAIAVHAPSGRMTMEQALAQLPAMHAAAARMRELL